MMNALKSHLDGLSESQRDIIQVKLGLNSNSSGAIIGKVTTEFDNIFKNI